MGIDIDGGVDSGIVGRGAGCKTITTSRLYVMG
jgi:hypothetical protein